ncbi:MAG: DsrE family protein [Planctomycetota bacterium]
MYRIAFLAVLLALGTFNVGCIQSSDSPNSSTNASGDSDAKIAVISITSDPSSDFQAVNMGLTFAGFCADEGYDTNIFLNVKGVKLATESFPNDLSYNQNSPLKKQLIALSERGVQIHVCPVCMKDLEIGNDEIIPEAFVTDKAKLFSKLGGDTMVFTY